MTQITAKQLTAVNLRYGTAAKSLKVLAFANLSAKALYLYGNAKTAKEIAKSVSKLINVISVCEDFIKSGLEELKDEQKVVVKDEKWSLTKETRKEMKDDASQAIENINGLIGQHFPKSIPSENLQAWFNDAIVDFFEHNGDEWVKSVCKGKQNFGSKAKTLDDILDRSIKSYSLEREAGSLKNSFRGFLTSTELKDQVFLTNTGFAMFSARLIAADIGADPIASDELSGATFLVDTNFLFALHLESHRSTSFLEALGQALNSIKAKVNYIRETKDEYERVWRGRKTEILRLFDIYPNNIIIDADDDFIATAKLRGCKKKEDFERFFDSINGLPKEIPNGPALEIKEDEKVNAEIEKGKKDVSLKKSVQKWCLKLRPAWNKTQKSNTALGHDAALFYVTEFENKSGNKTFILTLDRGLQACSSSRAGQHEIPSAICLEGLIQILAANNAGPGFDATNFAPLMSSILIKNCLPTEHSYSVQDLHWLYGIQKNVAEFSEDKIKTIALEVTKARLAGKNASDNKLQRTVNRLYQEEMQNSSDKVEKAVDRAQIAIKEAQSEKIKRIQLEEELKIKDNIEELRMAHNSLLKSLAWRIPTICIFGLLAYFIAGLVLNVLQQENFLDFLIGLFTIVTAGYKFLKKPISDYLEKKRNYS